MKLGAWIPLLVFSWVLPGLQYRFVNEVVPDLDVELQGIDTWRPPTVCRVFDHQGDQIDEFALVRREWLPIEELPDLVWQAVVAAEDRRFFEHNGVDLLGILRAAVVNLRAGAIREGGSTLTQQLVKNILVGSRKSYSRKLHEALLAWRLEQRMSKQDILELYLNLIYLGSGNYGVEVAALDYFGVSARDLDSGQAALLAGLIPAPSAYSPRRSPEVARKRRALVLDAMVQEDMIDVVLGQQEKRRPIDPPRRAPSQVSEVGTAYRTVVRREVRRLLGDEVPFSEGLQIHTPFDAEIQRVAEQAIREQAERIERRQGHPGRQRRLRPSQIAGFLEEARGLPRGPEGEVLLPEGEACFSAVSLGGRSMAAGPFRFRWDMASWWRWVRNHDYAFPANFLKLIVRYGEVYEVCYTEKDYVMLPDATWVEGAAVVVHNETGGVVALVGGRDVELEGFVRATQGLRQAGSSFKPYVYAAAIESGMTQIDSVLDAPLRLGSGSGAWQPRNSSGGYQGLLPMRRAMAFSINTVAVRLAMRAGIDEVVDLAHRAGVSSRLRRDLTLALGSSEVSVLDQAIGISTFPRMGRAIEPVFVSKLVDVRGAQVGEAGSVVDIEGVEVRLPGPPGRQIIAPGTAWQVVDMMRGVVSYGTGGAAFAPGQDRGGKTGTTSGFADAWFVGFTPEYTVAVWMGQDERNTLGKGEAGSRAALPAWKKIVDALPRDPEARLEPPPEVLLLPWNGQWVGVSADSVGPDRLPWEDPGEDPLPEFPAPRPSVCKPKG